MSEVKSNPLLLQSVFCSHAEVRKNRALRVISEEKVPEKPDLENRFQTHTLVVMGCLFGNNCTVEGERNPRAQG